MPKNLTPAECEALGIKFPCSQMDNGEYRFRLMGPDNSGYIRTVMPDSGYGWQNSHYHKGVQETWVIQSGWVGVADLLPDGQVKITVYCKNDVWTSHPGHHHNIYMSSGTVLHTVKHGDCSLQNDWFACAELDALSKPLTETDIFRLAGLSSEDIKRLAM